MVWFIPLITGAIQGVSGAAGASSGASMEKKQHKSTAKITNLMRKANNELAAAKGNFARAQQTRGNRATAKSAEQARDALMTNYLRSSEDAATGSMDRRIQASEEAGSLAAQVAHAGVGGGTIDMLNATANLRQDRLTEAAERIGIQSRSDADAELENFLPNMIMSLDETVMADDLNMTVAKAAYGQRADYTGHIVSALEGVAQSFALRGNSTQSVTRTAGPSTRGGYRGRQS